MVEEYFRISSGLKSLIGRELITDDFIAVFELVKNSFDANASRVDITFSNLSGESPTIEIRDNGKGMSAKDIRDKWLFVAYSAKKEGTEDYRQNIRPNRIYAGAKGIGRFSCDKLGANLELLSRTKSTGLCSRLLVDWDLFEEDATEDFIDIPVKVSRKKCDQPGFKKGTILKISGVREAWDRDKLLQLKRSITKLINPNQGNTKRKFSIYLHAKDELATDRKIPKTKSWDKVNGQIENFLFEELKIKATHIHVSIPEGGGNITTRLEDRGKFIYEVEEDNPYDLVGIDVFLFSLNQSAKSTFTRRMGLPPVQFGSIFLFKNGFRVYPFGEVRADPWGIDSRKQQGQARFFGTRDLLGRVEIVGENPKLQEVTSRDGGLLKNPTSEDLRTLFIDFALKRLERYTINIIRYGNEDLEVTGEYQSKALELILSLTKSKSIVDIDYDPKLFDILQEASAKSLNSLVTQFSRLAEDSDNPKLERDVRRAEKRIKALEAARKEAEEEAEQADKERAEAEKTAEQERERAEKEKKKAKAEKKKSDELISQNLFLQSMVSSDVSNLVGLHHHIGIAAGTIQNHVQGMATRIRAGRSVSTEMFLETLEKIAMQASQISSSSKFATKANFVMDAAILSTDLVEFIGEYIQNVCRGMYFQPGGKPIEFKWVDKEKLVWERKFRPFEIAMLLDNLFNNSKKAKATKVVCEVKKGDGDNMRLIISDNGKGLAQWSTDRIFELGYTTTSGSGFGLYHVSKILKQMGGSIRFDKKYKSGARFVIEIGK